MKIKNFILQRIKLAYYHLLTVVCYLLGRKFVFLHKGLGSNPDLEKIVFSTQNPEYLDYLDELFKTLYQGSCNNIQVKVNETADLLKFNSMVSELEFARYFLKNKMQVTLLSDNVFQGRKAPDILVQSNSMEYYVEVKNIQYDEESWSLGSKIAKKLNDLGLCFMVVINASSVLATPAYIHQTKKQKKLESQASFNEFVQKITSNIPDCKKTTIIKTKIADIELHPTKKNKSYLGMGTMMEAIGQPADYVQRFTFDIINKTKKRTTWLGDELDKNYIIAIDDCSILFSLDTFNAELFGHATFYCPEVLGDTTGTLHPPPMPKIKINKQLKLAIEQGWKSYLVKMCILRNDRSVIPENQRGLFFSEPVLKNATAMIVRNKKRYFLFANPFAEPKINNPKILTEFASAKTGWE